MQTSADPTTFVGGKTTSLASLIPSGVRSRTTSVDQGSVVNCPNCCNLSPEEAATMRSSSIVNMQESPTHYQSNGRTRMRKKDEAHRTLFDDLPNGERQIADDEFAFFVNNPSATRVILFTFIIAATVFCTGFVWGVPCNMNGVCPPIQKYKIRGENASHTITNESLTHTTITLDWPLGSTKEHHHELSTTAASAPVTEKDGYVNGPPYRIVKTVNGEVRIR